MAARRCSRTSTCRGTVGWFTSLFPVRLDPGAIDLAEALAGGRARPRAQEHQGTTARAARNGLGYGVLRYLNPQTAAQLAGFASRRSASTISGALRLGRRRTGAAPTEAVGLAAGDPRCRWPCIEVNALTLDARGRTLRATWTWAPALLTEAEVRDLAERWFAALEAVVRHSTAPGAGGRTPSDLPLVALSQAEIEELESAYPQIEDVLPLAPLQEGLLFHALYDAQAPDI